MHKTHAHPLRNQPRLRPRHRVEEAQRVTGGEMRVMAGNGVIQQGAQLVRLAACGKELKTSDPNMARRHPRHDGTRQRASVAPHCLAGRHHGQRASRRNAHRRHRLGNHIFAQHWANGRLAIPAARKRRAA